MGLLMSKLFNLFSSFNSGIETRLLMVGLDAAGKTTILYKLKLNETISTIPIIVINVETVAPVKGLNFTVWAVDGREHIRPLWKHYLQNTQGLLYVVDSSDIIRIEESREELFRLMETDETMRVPLVVLANKQDVPGAICPEQMIDRLQLRRLKSKWHLQGCCALNGDGIYEAMDAIARLVKENPVQ